MFYKTGVDITNDKSMFNFLHDHFTYDTLSSWNCLKSIANNVKVHHLGLDGDEWIALAILEDEEYDSINWMIRDWEDEHNGYKVGFNGRSGGYLVLYNDNNNGNVLPDHIADYDYEDYKQYCKDYEGSVRGNRYELRELTKLVQDFDKLCDELRSYVNELSKVDYTKVSAESAVDVFNSNYDSDLEFCGFNYLSVNEEGKVYIGELKQMNSLLEIFTRFLSRNEHGYSIKRDDDYMWLEED